MKFENNIKFQIRFFKLDHLLIITLIYYFNFSNCIAKTTPLCERKFKKEIKTHWNYDVKNKSYCSDMNFLKSFDSLYIDCLKRKDTTYLKSIIGNNFNYSTTGPITAMDFYFYQCPAGSECFLRFFFDQKSLKVISIRLWIDNGIRRR